jgi:AcrR family transcriptional regulator
MEGAKTIEAVSPRTRVGGSGGARRILAHDQRARIGRAAERLLCDRNVDRVSVGEVCAAAGCSRSTFYAVFSDRGELLLALFDDLTLRLGHAMAVVHRAEPAWASGVRAAMSELLAFLEATPMLARFLIVDSLAGDRRMLAHRSRALEQLARVLDADSPAASGRSLPAPFGGEAIVGAVVSVLHARLVGEPAPSLRELRGALMGLVVLPYLGVRAAQAELLRPPPPARPVQEIGRPPELLTEIGRAQ